MPQEELEAIEGTDEIKIVLKVEDASETVSAEDKLQVEAVLQENESLVLCQYLDLTLLKILNSSESEITNTISPIPVIFEVPEEFKKANRDFVVIRVHGDEITLLNDLDKVTNTVTIKTDKFSTYALAYIDKDKIKDNDENNSNNNEDNNKDDNNNNEGNPNTGVYVSIIPFTLAAASLSALTIKKKSK